MAEEVSVESWRESQYCESFGGLVSPRFQPTPLEQLAHDCGVTGGLFNQGLGGYPRDYAKAFQCFLWGAYLDNLSCQYNVGLWYFKGKGVPKDHSLALKWLHRAAQGGHLKATTLLNRMLERGSEDGAPT